MSLARKSATKKYARKKLQVIDVYPRYLAIDPSSTRTGWALFSDGRLADYGEIPAVSSWHHRQRTERIAEVILGHAKALQIETIVSEVSSGIAYKGRNAGGLYALGDNHGFIRAFVKGAGIRFLAIEETIWTGRKKKEVRQAVLKESFPSYRESADLDAKRGYNIADAIGVGNYYWLHPELFKE